MEPAEKYVTKAEFDDLKARFTELSALVHRLVPASGLSLSSIVSGTTGSHPGISTGLPGFPMSSNLSQVNPGGPQPGNYYPHQLPGTDSHDVSGQHSEQPSSPFRNATAYNSEMPPPPAPVQMPHFELATSSDAGSRYIKSETGVPASPSRAFTTSSSPRYASGAASSTSNAKLSLASITSTSPYHRAVTGEGTVHVQQRNPQLVTQTHMTSPNLQPFSTAHPQQPKNYDAQTLNSLGARLRNAFRKLGPAKLHMLMLTRILTSFPVQFSLFLRPQSFIHRAFPYLLYLMILVINNFPAPRISLHTLPPLRRTLAVPPDHKCWNIHPQRIISLILLLHRRPTRLQKVGW